MIELETFRGEARKWFADQNLPVVPLDIDGRFEVLRAWQRTLFESGWLGISWSTEVGGRGLSPVHQLVFNEELVRARAPQPIGLIGLEVVGRSIEHYGSDWQRRELLPRLLSGEDIWCQGFSEPEAGSDLASLRTSARDAGEDFVVSGQKVWTSWAKQAQWCALLVRTDRDAPKHKGISYLLVDMSSPGITVRPLVQMTGDEEFCEVFFDEVSVPKRNLVGEINAGWAVANHTLGSERGSYTVRRRAELEVAFDDAVAQVQSWSGGGRERVPDRVAAALGKAQIALQVLEGQTRKTIDRLVAAAGPTAEDSLDKLLLNGVEQAVFESVVDLLGPFRTAPNLAPFGLEAERWIHDHYFSRAVSIYGGTSQIQRNIIAQRILGLPRG
ncbi:acyl-CoA dehydrogenase family protein (plasmid) [Pseudonocardia bannensis]|uniref:Acyl-CoA dehydrogenase n=1 Tax=Pseudonocardia bannensis TaxID=630973 RepID=A0A848DID3_9PSEU|nr:acyl-CoA dehydrogenase family protein [Pseudonocardia bannensis]NMH92452.1 acyl-CoA dehydrogenase [Pseudonocardia bannensis]